MRTSSKLLTLTLSVNGEPETCFFKTAHDVHSYVEARVFEFEVDGLTVTDETWVKCDDVEHFEVELTVESEEDESEEDECA